METVKSFFSSHGNFNILNLKERAYCCNRKKPWTLAKERGNDAFILDKERGRVNMQCTY
jgi:hypothetical protein